jgi:hypothetical protein
VLPSGGFLFHEVGFLEQLIYLMFFAAVWLGNRQHWWWASIVIALSITVHEMALLTVLPLFAFVVLRSLDCKFAVRILAAPLAIGLTVVALPPTSHAAVHDLGLRLRSSNFHPRGDALQLFVRTQHENWKLYDPRTTFATVVPVALLLAASFFVLTRLRAPRSSLLYASSGAAAVAAPALLALGGWDANRWKFLAISNFVIVVWLWITDCKREPATAELIVLLCAFFVAARTPLPYFDGLQPRHLDLHDIRQFARQLMHGAPFRIPRLG